VLNIYKSINKDNKFVFYRNNSYNKSSFCNMSKSNYTKCVYFDDNFTNILVDNDSELLPYGEHINNLVQKFHTSNTELFNNRYFDEYFNDINLWKRLNLSDMGNEYLDKHNIYNIKLDNIHGIYYIGLIPLLTNNDIYSGLKLIISKHDKNIYDEIHDNLLYIHEIVHSNIKFLLDDIINEQDIVKYFNQINTTQSMYLFIIKKYIIDGMPIQKYIITKYLVYINTISNDKIKTLLISIINLFILDNIQDMPLYKTYMKDYQNNGIIINPIKDNNNDNYYLSFAISSIWYYITNNIIKNYNDFFSNVTDIDYIKLYIGSNTLTQIKYINKYYTNNLNDYWQYNSDNVCVFLNNKINNTKLCITKYNDNVELLKYIHNLSHECCNISSLTTLIKQQKCEGSYIHKICDEIITQYRTLDDEYNDMINEESNNELLTYIIELYKNVDNSLIFTNIDLYKSFMEYILKTWSYTKSLGTEKNINNRIIELKNTSKNIKTLLLNSNQNAKFAWIKRLGFYIIDNISIYIGGQLIDKQNGEWLNIWYELTKTKSKIRGYDRLIGNIPDLTTFDSIPKKGYEMIIPLQFWFCRNIGLSLPLVALLHTDIKITVKLRQFNEIMYADENIYYSPQPKLSCYMMAEYIFVEGEERSRLAKNKLEYLIDVVQTTDEHLISSDTFSYKYNDIINGITYTNLIRQQIHFFNPIREIIWFYQDINYINGKAPNGERKYYNYSNDYITEYGTTMKYAKILFSSRERQPYMDNLYYNYITPLQYHTSTPSDGIYTYSFCLSPEIYQPSGSANMSKIDDFFIVTLLNDIVYQKIINNGVNMRFKLYCTSYNVLRIMSGQAGLAFYK
jgi:hypothetical protein